MAAFNYRDLVRLIRPRSWDFYFNARAIPLLEDASREQATEELHQPVDFHANLTPVFHSILTPPVAV